jgi:hypothetical protein
MMYPWIPAEVTAGALEMVCCFLTAVTAVFSCLLTLRG